jgi:hypothetical protein
MCVFFDSIKTINLKERREVRLQTMDGREEGGE